MSKAKTPDAPPRLKLKDFYKPKPSTQGATSNGWHQIMDAFYCLHLYKLRQVVKLRKPLLGTPDPLAKGSLFHVGRAGWYESGFKTSTAVITGVRRAMEQAFEEAPHPMTHTALADAWSYVEQYIEHWSMRPLPKVVGVEYLLGPIPLSGAHKWWLQRTARLDDVSFYPEAPNGALCIGECKTTSVGADDVANEYDLHGQLLMQYLLWRAAPNGEAKHGPAAYVMLDVVKKGYGKEKCTFARMPVHVTQTSLGWYLPMMEAKLKETALITAESQVPRNITACTRQIGRMRVPCEFRELCKRGDSVASAYVTEDGTSAAKAFASWKVKPWD